ncbi:MAG: putative metal-binding motif-containing protein [Alphaproteobacteria bacterium]|nr:putative metal-binding motif-containing protein [Alphaproteobacteria bacterium]MCB9792294.1 putative metal-binding motif-containing protein [Alphaproteobacteria bacterium]
MNRLSLVTLAVLALASCGEKDGVDDSVEVDDSAVSDDSAADDSASDDSASDDSAGDDSGVEDQDGDGVPASLDCDDNDPEINPNAREVCDEAGVDEDCDGLVNDDDPSLDPDSAGRWYPDADADGYGDQGLERAACEAPEGMIDVGGDCDDQDADVNPGRLEVCDPDDVDEDCDGVADDADRDVDTGSMATYYDDRDQDGYGDDGTADAACDPLPGQVNVGGDCDDADRSSNPGAPEVCDSRDTDEDCDGLVDDDDPSVLAASMNTFYQDLDGDRHGDPSVTQQLCDLSAGWARRAGDCDDTDATVNSSATEICDDGLDNDCDGLLDCEDGRCVSDPVCLETTCDDGLDDDGDGFVDCFDDDCWGNGCDVDTLATVQSIARASGRQAEGHFAYNYYTFNQGNSSRYEGHHLNTTMQANSVTGTVVWATPSSSVVCDWSANRATLVASFYATHVLRQRRSSVLTSYSRTYADFDARRQGFALSSACPFTVTKETFLPERLVLRSSGAQLSSGGAWYQGTPSFFGGYYAQSSYTFQYGRGSGMWGYTYASVGIQLNNPTGGDAYARSWR